MIKDLRELRALMTLCRKAGVKEIKFGDVSLVMGETPAPRRRRGRTSEEPLTPDMPSDEELAFFSAGSGAFGENN